MLHFLLCCYLPQTTLSGGTANTSGEYTMLSAPEENFQTTPKYMGNDKLRVYTQQFVPKVKEIIVGPALDPENFVCCMLTHRFLVGTRREEKLGAQHQDDDTGSWEGVCEPPHSSCIKEKIRLVN
ncbi:hypothetical protein F5882DRAFT_385059 [Hyaloscypha sp. PMI_1271]|nr:hypothetical protein F5882DRAFT_385059 [Hyaloscypha sp. PMI_1271]